MASLFLDKKAYRIQFVDENKQKKSIYLGKISKRNAKNRKVD